jgi:hypothetical protein
MVSWDVIPLKMEAARFSETLVSYITIWCHNPEDHNLNLHHCENPNSCRQTDRQTDFLSLPYAFTSYTLWTKNACDAGTTEPVTNCIVSKNSKEVLMYYKFSRNLSSIL